MRSYWEIWPECLHNLHIELAYADHVKHVQNSNGAVTSGYRNAADASPEELPASTSTRHGQWERGRDRQPGLEQQMCLR